MSSILANIVYSRSSYVIEDGQTHGQVFINLTGAGTDSPVNGNNCIVNYTINSNGILNTQDAIIAGQTWQIYDGLLSDSNTGYYTQFTINSVTPHISGAPTPPLDGPSCDLSIDSITSTNETGISADDGTITVNASSSNGPIQYSIDDETWQDSNVFTGLPGGSGFAYVKDALECTDNKSFFILTNTNLLTNDPSVDLGNGNISRWNAAYNPVYFIFQRKDYIIFSITQAQDGSNNIFVTLNTTVSSLKPGVDSVINGVNVHTNGDFVYIKTALYEGTFEVTAVGSDTLIVNCPYTVDDSAGYANINALRPYYQIQSVITYVDPVTSKLKSITVNNVPLTNGYLRADFSSFLQSLLRAKDLSNYTLINYRDAQLSASYQVKYAEVWDGNAPAWIELPLPYYVVYAAKQLGDVGGGNLQEYVPYVNGFQPAKWITDFKYPVYNDGFPFDISFIFSEYMVGLAPFYHITLLDINMNPLTDQSVDNAYLLNEDGGFVLNEDGSKFIIAASDIVNFPIVEHVGLNRLLINFNVPDICWYFKLELKYTSGGNTFDLMQPITCRIDQNTTDRPVYMRWIGLSGSWNYYKFVYNQVVGLDVSDPVITKNFIIDWATEDSIEEVIGKSAGQKMQVFAENMTVNDIKAVQAIKYSPKVQILTSLSPIKWQTVVIAAASYTEYETMLDQYSFGITFNLPSINIQTQ